MTTCGHHSSEGTVKSRRDEKPQTWCLQQERHSVQCFSTNFEAVLIPDFHVHISASAFV